MNLGWTLRRTSPAAVIMLLVGGLFLVSTSQAPRTQDASYDVPSMFLPASPTTMATRPAPTTTTTVATTTTTAPAPIVYHVMPPGGRHHPAGGGHPVDDHPAFGLDASPSVNLRPPLI